MTLEPNIACQMVLLAASKNGSTLVPSMSSYLDFINYTCILFLMVSSITAWCQSSLLSFSPIIRGARVKSEVSYPLELVHR